jgi:transmembrane sensor
MEFLEDDNTYGMSDPLLGRYITGETSPDENIQVKKWIDTNDNNSRYMEGLMLIIEHSRLPVTAAADEQLAWSTLSKKIKQRANNKASVRLLYKWTGAAAAVLLLAGIFFIVNRKDVSVINTAVAIKELNGNGFRSDTLSDGSIVRLGNNSTLFIPLVFDNTHRSVKLKGGGYFSVVHNTKQPFRITVNDVQVTDAGTSFIIQSDSSRTSVAVLSGLVEITRNNKSILLAQGEKLQVYKKDSSLQKSKVNTETLVTGQPVGTSTVKKITGPSLEEDPKELKKAMRSILRDITGMKLVQSSDSIVWFGLTVGEFIINGQKQPAAVQQLFSKKYHVKPGNGFFYGPVQMIGNGFFLTKNELNEP